MNTSLQKTDQMIPFQDALEIIRSKAKVLQTETVSLNESYKRVLAEAIFSDMDMPPFNKSAMDGYACRKEDLGNELVVIETIYAGKQPEKIILENQCSKIMTGAVVPEGADVVFMIEDSIKLSDHIVKCANPGTKPNICYTAEDIKKGDKLIDINTLVQSKHLPVIAGAGKSLLKVYKQPNIGIFATGTELVEPENPPLPHQIRNSNTSQIIGQLKDLGLTANYYGIIKDDETVTKNAIKETLVQNDLLILTGGVSVGDYDLIPGILNTLGFEISVTKTAIQPGKPMIFANKGNKYCFGLSGNPVSSFIQFILYVKPFIYSIMGYDYKPVYFQLPLSRDFTRKKAGRLLLRPGNISSTNEIVPVEFHGSAHISAFVSANCLFEIPAGITEIKKGQQVNVRPI